MTERSIGTDINQVNITSLSHIQGQPQVQELLRVSIDAYFQNRANSEKSTFGPVLLLGPSGTGKTITAKAIHCELANLTLIETNGEMLNQTSELTSILLTADDNTSIFIDEAQSLGNKAQHILLTAISEKKLYAARSRSSRLKRQIPLANFVLILASTHEFQLQDALRNRMRLYCRFDYYSIDDLTNIVKQRADVLGWQYESLEVLHELAKRAKHTPRLALNRNLQMAWNVASSHDRNVITQEDVLETCRLLQIDSLGLDSVERAYLAELSNVDSRRLNVIASKIGLPRQTLSNVIEPYLLRTGLIEKVGSERALTEKGRTHLENRETPHNE